MLDLTEAIELCQKHGFCVIPKNRVKEIGVRHTVSGQEMYSARDGESLLRHVHDKLADMIGNKLFYGAATVTRKTNASILCEEFEARITVVLP